VESVAGTNYNVDKNNWYNISI